MDFHKILNKLTQHTVFKEWHSKNKNYFLAHAFLMLDDANKDTWQIGFYNADKEKMVTFLISPTEVKHTEDQEVLRSEQEIQKLEPEKIKLVVEEALEKTKQFLKGQDAFIVKTFFIIQQYHHTPIYNITYFLQTMETVNVKVNAETGEIVHHDRKKLLDMGK
ncbi:hypothetical protein COV18_02390 [Candidatus Woesearchaeota archaeon CG10_big_fil_rev_8_21_14_0_10_37_12]|nr:MAG: hypothetical protein COV18_02390 [Candidatus Woesearchaeota archaeon CG10_big_fil_rev_8_21_14_0_10_37_12]